MQSISYFPAGLMISPGGLSTGDLKAIAPRLEAARKEVLADARLWAEGSPVPPPKQPLDAGFIELPERLLAELREKKGASILAQVRAVADRLAGAVDRVVVLGIGGSYMGARALLEACCHPFHNELLRDPRRGRPRMYFEGNNVDNDALLGLFDILGNGHVAGTIDSRWAIVVISKSGGTLETAVAFRLLLPLLEKSLEHDSLKTGDLVVPITGRSGKLFDLAQAIGCRDRFEVPDGIGGRYSVLTPVGLLPAAILGLDVRLMVEGAAEMNKHFRTAPVGQNVVLDYVAACHLMETERGCDVRVLSTWGKRLEAVGLWYDQLLAESLGKEERGALPLTVVNTRDLHSRGQQFQEGKRDKLITNMIVGAPQRPPLAVSKSVHNQDDLNQFAGKALPEILVAAIMGTNQAYREDHRPTADLHMTQLDEYSLGQFFQMMMLATVVEGRLIGINPFGQPGVEAYKRNMMMILKE